MKKKETTEKNSTNKDNYMQQTKEINTRQKKEKDFNEMKTQ